MRNIVIFMLLLALPGYGYSQQHTKTFGITGGSHYYPDGLRDWTNNGKGIYSVSGGLFYDHNFNEDIGISVSATHRVKKQELRPLFNCFQCPQQDTAVYRLDFKYLDFALNAAINLNSNKNAKWKSYLLLGYTYGNLYSLKNRIWLPIKYIR